MQRLAILTGPAAGFLACLLGGCGSAARAAGHERNGLVLGIAVAIVDLALLSWPVRRSAR